MPNRIACRAKVAEACLDGQLTRFQFGAGYDDEELDPPMSEDGTFDGTTVVCDPCYVTMGAPTNEELPATIEAFRKMRDREHG
jgi:hypothetical protein